jgi:hypothetical protein
MLPLVVPVQVSQQSAPALVVKAAANCWIILVEFGPVNAKRAQLEAAIDVPI